MKNIGKRSLSAVLALLMICSCFVIGVYAAESPVKINGPEMVYGDDGNITAKFTESYEGEGTYTATYAISPSAMAIDTTGGKTFIVKAGTKYTLTVTITMGEETYTVNKAFSVKEKRDKPVSITATPTTDTITINKINGTNITAITDAEYRLLDKNDNVVYDWGTKTKFTGLTPSTQYTINARFKETDKYLASDYSFLTKKTLGKYTGTVPAVEFTSVSKNSITFKKVNNAVYSLDGGTTWQTSNVFSGLKPDTVYQATLKIVDPDGIIEDSKNAAVVAIRTNETDIYTAVAADAVLDGIKSGGTYSTTSANTFKAYSVGRTSGKAQWGDTKLIPTGVSAVNLKSKNTWTGTVMKLKTDGKEDKYWTCSIQPKETGTTNIIVHYAKFEYHGKDAKGNEIWEAAGTVDKTVSVNCTSTPLSLLNFLNVFTNTLPRLLTQFIEILRKYGISILLAI